MSNLGSIISNNAATFYNFRTGAKVRIWPRIIFYAIIASGLSIVISEKVTNFVGSVNTILSVLLGFSFSVLFYIASTRPEAPTEHHAALEDRNSIDRIALISRELFHNVSYFVVAASACLAIGLIAITPEFYDHWLKATAIPQLTKIYSGVPGILHWAGVTVRAIFFFLLFESAYTFVRIVGRVNYLFEEKLGR